MGEYAYQGLWWGSVLLPLLLAVVRFAAAPTDMTFALFTIIGLPAIVAGQVIAGLLAWTYRRRQWRHWLGPMAARLSFIYYVAWVVLALALPESRPGEVYPSVLMGLFGSAFANGLSAVLFWLIPVLYVTLLASIIVEGERAVRKWRKAPTA